MELTPMLTSVFVMAIVIGIGALIGNRLPLTADSRQLMIMIIVNVAMPCIIPDGVFQTPIDYKLLKQIFAIFVVSILLNCLGILIGWIAAKPLRLPEKKQRELAILSGLGNTGFIGLPLCAALFGAKGALLAAVFDVYRDAHSCFVKKVQESSDPDAGTADCSEAICLSADCDIAALFLNVGKGDCPNFPRSSGDADHHNGIDSVCSLCSFILLPAP